MGGIANHGPFGHAMVILMARTKNAPKKGKGSGEGTSRGRCAGKEGRRRDTWLVREAKRRKDQAKEELEEWQQSIQRRGVTCERQMQREQIIDVTVIRTQSRRRLGFFLQKDNRGMVDRL